MIANQKVQYHTRHSINNLKKLCWVINMTKWFMELSMQPSLFKQKYNPTYNLL